MFKLASLALLAAVGTAGIAQACPSVSVGPGFPAVTVIPRVAYSPVVYRPILVAYHREWRHGHEFHWHRDHDRYEHFHRWG